MVGKTKRKARRRSKPRNPLVPATKRLGQRVVPSAKSYSRKPKHRGKAVDV